MKTTFGIDLLRPGQIAHGRYEWFVGPGAPRRLLKVFAVGVTVLALVLAGGLAPRYWRHSADLRRIAQLKQEIATTTADMAGLRGQLTSMSAEARRQVRWTELLATLSREAPAALKLHRVSLRDRKSTRLNSSHLVISYAVFCLKKKKKNTDIKLCDSSI